MRPHMFRNLRDEAGGSRRQAHSGSVSSRSADSAFDEQVPPLFPPCALVFCVCVLGERIPRLFGRGGQVVTGLLTLPPFLRWTRPTWRWLTRRS